jgi:hypothetical protein
VGAATFGLIGLTLCCRETGPAKETETAPLPCWAQTLSKILHEDFIRAHLLMPGKAPVYAVLLCVASLSAVYIREQHPESHTLFLLCTVTSAIIGLVLFCLGSFRIDTLGQRIDTLGHRMDTLEHRMDEQFRNTNEMIMILMSEEQKQVLRAQQFAVELRAERGAANETAQSTLSNSHGSVEMQTPSSEYRNAAAATAKNQESLDIKSPKNV